MNTLFIYPQHTAQRVRKQGQHGGLFCLRRLTPFRKESTTTRRKATTLVVVLRMTSIHMDRRRRGRAKWVDLRFYGDGELRQIISI